MEDWFVVNLSKTRLVTATLITIYSISLNSLAETNTSNHNTSDNIERLNIESSNSANTISTQTVRFYKANKHLQRIRLYPSKNKTGKPGCHNFKRSRRIAEVVQIGYDSCSIYTQKNCDSDSIIKAKHAGQDTYSERLTEGHGWFPKPQSEKDRRGVKLRSWSCQ